MATLLRVDASTRIERSITRTLTDAFVESWSAADPGLQCIERDVGLHPPEAISEQWVRSAFTPESERTKEMSALLRGSDELVREVLRSDAIVIGAPMYNYGMPAALKAWVDQIVRVNETFSFDLGRGDFPVASTLTGKSLIVLMSRGEFGFEPGGVRDGWDHLTPHLRTIGTQLLGVRDSDFHSIAAEYQEFGDHRHDDSVRTAIDQAKILARRLAAGDEGEEGVTTLEDYGVVAELRGSEEG